VRHLPIFLALQDRPALVVGGGELAARKVRLLRRAGARVEVVARRLDDELSELAGAGTLAVHERAFRDGDVDGCAVVFAATGEAAVDERVARAARAAGIPVNAADRPDISTFIMPAIVDRDPIVIGISSGGTAPVLARRVRGWLERLLPARLGRLALFAEAFRSAVKATVSDPVARRRFWERFFDSPAADAVLNGDESGAREAMLRLVNAPQAALADAGSVAIVGAGPGDPELLTLRAHRLLQHADVVIHDALAAPEVLDLARRDAERIYVGKTRARHARTQAEINDLMAETAGRGLRIVRLKGGDPFVFGRGGEEVAFLRARGIAVEVVPGITAATGCAAAAGFPLTHRDLAGAAVLVTGQSRDGGPEPDWAALARARHTIVVYMGMAELPSIAARLAAHGLDPATPAAIVENGTRPEQRIVAAPLGALPDEAAAAGIGSPALIVIGEVVSLSEAWQARGVAAVAPRRASA
jgi:uroporphyrin-III C-methyltransferase/precorrin-2 dehydrogenase/sirohydrochlorin ferrochelatase